MNFIMKQLLRKLFFLCIGRPYLESSASYVKWLRQKGLRIGEGTIIVSPVHTTIDVSRPELVDIGENVLLHKGTIILTHDYASRAFVNRYNEFIPSHGRIKIGNNVWLGENVTILKNVEIGDNVIIGTGALVSKSIPSNSVAVGRPAKVFSSFDEYYCKRKKQFIDEAIDYALSIYESGRKPEVDDFYDDYPAFVDGRNYMEYKFPYSRVFTVEQFEQWKHVHQAPFFGFDEFMRAVDERRAQHKRSCNDSFEL